MSTCAVAAQRSRKIESAMIGVAVRALVGEEDREHERGDEAGAADDRRRRPCATRAGTSTATSSSDAGRGEQRERRREREPVDVRLVDHRFAPAVDDVDRAGCRFGVELEPEPAAALARKDDRPRLGVRVRVV